MLARIALIIIISSVTIFSSINTFASFNSDYAKFIAETLKNAPSLGVLNPNVVSGSLVGSYETTVGDRLYTQGSIGFKGQIDSMNQNTELSLSISGSYTTQSGTQFIDTAAHTVIVPNENNISKFYLTLDHFTSNASRSQETEVQSLITKLTANWYVGTGESDSIGIDQVLGQSKMISSITQNLDTQMKLYQQMVKYPVITPIGQQNANSIYNIRLNKRNMARIITVLTTISDESSIASDRNEMRSNIYRNMASVRSNGTFDPMSNDIQLNLVNEDSSPTIVGLTPKSLKILVTDTGANQAMLASTWDRNMISLQASGVVDDDTIFSVQMVTTSHHAQLLGSYTDDTSAGSLNAQVDFYSDDVTVIQPEDALSISELDL